MIPQDWESLFTVVLSHGEFLTSRRLNRFWFTLFVRSTLGLDEPSAHKTGITPLFLELLWRRRHQDTEEFERHSKCDEEHHGLSSHSLSMHDAVDASDATCSFEEFVKMMEKLSVRCHQSLRASELLHRFNERAAITSTAPQSMSIAAALDHMTRYYFAKACEQSFVSRDSVITLDPSRSTLPQVGRLVLSHLFASLMDAVVMPVFLRFSTSGRMTMTQYTAFVGHAFTGRKLPNEHHIRAVFCQVNRNDDIVETLANTYTNGNASLLTVTSPTSLLGSPSTAKPQPRKVNVTEQPPATIELVEFLDALCLLGVVMFSNEVTYKHLRTVEGKVWALMDQLCQIEGLPMCSVVSSYDELRCLQPRIALVYPTTLPVYTATSFVVSGLCLENAIQSVVAEENLPAPTTNTDTTSTTAGTSFGSERKPLPLSARASIDTKQSVSASSARVYRTGTQHRMMATPSTKDLTSINATIMLQSRTRQNAVSQISSSLFTDHFEHAAAKAMSSRTPHKPLGERVGLKPTTTMAEMYESQPMATAPAYLGTDRVDGFKSPGSSSSMSAGSRPSTAASATIVQSLAGTITAGVIGSPPSVHDDDVHAPPLGYTVSSGALRDQPSPVQSPQTKQPVLPSPPVYFTVDGHRVLQAEQLPSNRLKLQLPVEALLPANQYVTFCSFHLASSAAASINPEDSSASLNTSVVCTLHRERVAFVSLHKKGDNRPYNTRPITLKLKPIRQLFTVALQEALEELFEDCAPSGRMDRAQFTGALQVMRNCSKVPQSTQDNAFDLFSSTTNGECRIRLAEDEDRVAVVWDPDGATLPGPPRLSFLGFLHAVALVHLDVDLEASKLAVQAAVSSTTIKVINMMNMFEQAFDEAKLRLHASSRHQGGASSSPHRLQRRTLDELVDTRDDATLASWDQRTQAPYDRAQKWRAYNKKQNEVLGGALREEFQRLLASAPPAPNFISNNPNETLLSAVVAAPKEDIPESDTMELMSLTYIAPTATESSPLVVEAPPPSTAKALAEVLARTSANDALLSFEARSQSMRHEYFKAAMIRTLSNRSRF